MPAPPTPWMRAKAERARQPVVPELQEIRSGMMMKPVVLVIETEREFEEQTRHDQTSQIQR